jgi:hypothetical protein
MIGLDLFAIQRVSPFDPGAAVLQVGGKGIRFVDESRFNAVNYVEVAINVIAYLVITGATFRAVSQLYLGGTAEAGASLRFAVGKIHSLLWVGLLWVIGVGIGLILLVIPGIFLLVAWSVAVPVLMVEGTKGTGAISRSQRLVKDNWWRTFGALLVGFIFIGLFQFLLTLAAGAFDGTAEDHLGLWVVIVNVIQAVATTITAPLEAAIITVIYFNLRVRKEGFDLQLLAQGIEGTPVPPTEPAPAVAPQPAPESTPPPA